MTPYEAIAYISKTFPQLDLKNTKSQSSFFLPHRGNSGRVIRIAYAGGKPVKRAASSLNARQHGTPDDFEIPLPATFDALQLIVQDEMALGNSVALVNWEKALRALEVLGGTATVKQITDRVLADFPDFADADNVRKDLIMMSVNDVKRRAYRAHNTMRRDGRSEQHLNQVFSVLGVHGEQVYESYDVLKHGVWVGRIVDGKFKLERANATVGDLLDLLEFDPSGTSALTKEMLARQVAARRGQNQFRKGLIKAYGAACCISGCTIERLLEAAHITPHVDDSTDVIANGLLLRADLHTLFDLGLLRVHPETLMVELHPDVLEDADYVKFKDTKIANAVAHKPSIKALQAHYDGNAHNWPNNTVT